MAYFTLFQEMHKMPSKDGRCKNPDSRYEIPISKDILSGIQCCSQSKDFKSIQPKNCAAENFSYLFLLQYGKRGLNFFQC